MQVLRRYLGTPAENSFAQNLPTPDRNSVVVTEGCAHVKDGGILITLGTIDGGGTEVKVAVDGFVACAGATWVTYVVLWESGGWQVTGTTGPRGIA